MYTLEVPVHFQHGLPLGQWKEAGQEAHNPWPGLLPACPHPWAWFGAGEAITVLEKGSCFLPSCFI